MAVDSWTETEWRQFYRVRASRAGAVQEPGGGWILGYGKEYLTAGDPTRDHLAQFRERWSALTTHYPIGLFDRVLVVGCGFGYLMDAAHEAGFANVWGIDSSPYVAARKGIESSGSTVIVEADIRGVGGQLKNTFRQLTGDDEFDWIITEDVVSCYRTDDAEGANQNVLNLAPLLDTLLFRGLPDTPRVIHMTSVAREPGIGGDSALTWLTLQEWRDLFAANGLDHGFISVTGEV